MEIVKLPEGQRAPISSDCISVESLPDGKYKLNGSVLLRCGDADTAESVALIGGKPYETYESAEAAGLAWAADHCAETVYISTAGIDDGLPDVD